MTAAHNPYIQPNDGPWMRRYLNWAQPHYDKALPEVRTDMVAVDRWLYGGGARGIWLGLALGLACLVLGLYLAGLPFWVASVLGACVAFICTVAATRAWFADDLLQKKPQHARFRWLRSPWSFAVGLPLVVLLGALVGHLAASIAKAAGGLSLGALSTLALGSLAVTVPFGLALAGGE